MFELLSSPEYLWILLVGFAVAFLLAFSVGANDVSNSFGTSVGSRVLTVTQACILATFFEVAGATLLGYSVCDTLRKNMYKVEQYEGNMKELMLGALSCLIGSAAWNLIATALKMPISGTHSIVGATIGFSIVLRGWDSINWWTILRIVASWFASPLLAGAISSIIYLLISKTVIRKDNPLKYGLKALPLFYGATIFINVASVLISGPDLLGLDNLSWYTGLFISLVIAAGVICLVALRLVPRLRKQITDEIVLANENNKKINNEGGTNKRRRRRGGNKSKSSTNSNEQPQKSLAGLDNVAFKNDSGIVQIVPSTNPNGEDNQTGSSGRVVSDTSGPPKPKRELALSPSLLDANRPIVAPKPAFLLQRQQALNDGQQVLEEIDLKSPSKPSSGGLTKRDLESANNNNRDSQLDRPDMIRGERLEVFRLFSSLQILTACFASFAHGTNDVSNAVAPLIPIWNIYADGFEDISKPTPVWILAFGGLGICTGLWAWGRAVMNTVGDGLTQLTPSKGFSIELGAAISVLTATKLKLPISTTHCKVGSVVIVGLISSKFCSQDNLLDMSDEEREEEDSKKAVDWKLFTNIAITWLVTVPLSALTSALVMLILKWVAL